jgi:nucleoid-associated protein YgaU
MRTRFRIVFVAVAMAVAGCDRPVEARSADEAVFELGGDAKPLSQWLEAARKRQQATTRVEAPVLQLPTPKLPVRVRIARLQSGETLSDLCRRELGDANAWRKVAEFNGWSEADLRRLSVGTEVRLPVD